MPRCSVRICKNGSDTSNKSDGISFHRFPREPELKKKWIAATGRGPDYCPTKSNAICSQHFEEKCFRSKKKSRRLFEWAVPTLRLRHMCIPYLGTSSEVSGPSTSEEPSKVNSDDDLNSDDDISSDDNYSTSVPKNIKKESIEGETSHTSTGDSVTCNKCGKQINSGFRWKCVECEYYEVCSVCEAKRVHAKHFVLRVPAHKPQWEVDRVVTALRQELQLGRHSEGLPQDATETAQEQKKQGETTEERDAEEIIIKTEIKEELPDPLEATTQYPESSRPHVNNPMEQSYITIEMVKTEPVDESDAAPTPQGGGQSSESTSTAAQRYWMFSVQKQPPSNVASEAMKRSAPPLPPPPLTKRPALASKTETFTHTSSGKIPGQSPRSPAKKPSGKSASSQVKKTSAKSTSSQAKNTSGQSASSQAKNTFGQSPSSQAKKTSSPASSEVISVTGQLAISQITPTSTTSSRKSITICEKSDSSLLISGNPMSSQGFSTPGQLASNQDLPCEFESSQDYTNTPSQSASSQSHLNTGQLASSQDFSDTYGQSTRNQDFPCKFESSQDYQNTSIQSASSQSHLNTPSQLASSQGFSDTHGQSASSQATSSDDEGSFKMEVFSHGSRSTETGKSRAEYMRDYRQKKREEKIKRGEVELKKIARNSTERSRDFRARQRAQLYNDNVDCDDDDQGNSSEQNI